MIKISRNENELECSEDYGDGYNLKCTGWIAIS